MTKRKGVCTRGKEREEGRSSKGKCKLQLGQELAASKINCVSNSIDPILGERPIACVDTVPNGGED
jgi:hypothetical protein